MLRFGITNLKIASALLFLPVALSAQTTAPPADSVIARMLSPGLFRLLDYQIASAAFGGQRVMVLEFPKGAHWSRVAAHVLRTVNARVATKGDSSILAVGIRDIRFAGDTLIASLFEEFRQLCSDGKWMHTGTDYEARTRRVHGGGWTRLELKAGLTWDGWCLGDA